jgi:hypothetical protein
MDIRDLYQQLTPSMVLRFLWHCSSLNHSSLFSFFKSFHQSHLSITSLDVRLQNHSGRLPLLIFLESEILVCFPRPGISIREFAVGYVPNTGFFFLCGRLYGNTFSALWFQFTVLFRPLFIYIYIYAMQMASLFIFTMDHLYSK